LDSSYRLGLSLHVGGDAAERPLFARSQMVLEQEMTVVKQIGDLAFEPLAASGDLVRLAGRPAAAQDMPSSLDNAAVAWTVPTASLPHPSKNCAWYSDGLKSYRLSSPSDNRQSARDNTLGLTGIR
jgi:hypothetical protein